MEPNPAEDSAASFKSFKHGNSLANAKQLREWISLKELSKN
jgi:hypothetical protein